MTKRGLVTISKSRGVFIKVNKHFTYFVTPDDIESDNNRLNIKFEQEIDYWCQPVRGYIKLYQIKVL